jgi:hypothetical protein
MRLPSGKSLTSGANQKANYLQGLGVDEIIGARDLSEAGSPLGKERWAGAIDSLGRWPTCCRTSNMMAQWLHAGWRRATTCPYRNAIHSARRDHRSLNAISAPAFLGSDLRYQVIQKAPSEWRPTSMGKTSRTAWIYLAP